MRFMGLLKADKSSEAGVPPSPELLERMGKFMEEIARAGVLIASDGLQPSSKGARAKLSGGKVTVSNRAIGGRSVQTWLYDVSSTLGTDGECVLNSTTYQSAWTAMLTGMKAGDYLFIQFGINDGDPNCPRHVGTALYQNLLTMMIHP